MEQQHQLQEHQHAHGTSWSYVARSPTFPRHFNRPGPSGPSRAALRHSSCFPSFRSLDAAAVLA